MNRDDKSKYLLYIEPNPLTKSKEPLNDSMTKLLEMALKKSKEGTGHYSSLDDDGTFNEGWGYKGVHRTPCGAVSSNCDYLLENGLITNSLAPYYVMWFRDSIGENDLNKIKELARYYNVSL